MRQAWPLLALGLLAGCNSSGSAPAEPASPTETPSAAASASAPDAGLPEQETVASASPAASASATALPAPVAGQDPVPCSAQAGAAKSAALVRQCIAVSPATHPPCNAANSCALIRNEIARGCALIGKTGPDCKTDPYGAAAATDAIQRYYDAINAHDYGAAWALWGKDGTGNPEQTFDEFVKGFASTRRTHVEIGAPGAIEGAAGSLYVTVPVTVDAVLDNGRRQHFTGSYVLRQPNRGVAPSQGWHITSATLRRS